MASQDGPNSPTAFTARPGEEGNTQGQQSVQDQQTRINQYKMELRSPSGQFKYRKPLYMLFFGSTKEQYEKRIITTILHLEEASTMLTNAEQREILADATASDLTAGDMGFPLSIALTLYMSMKKKNRDALAFPFIGGMKNPDPTMFPSRSFMNKNPWLPPFIASRGVSGVFCWHMVRFMAYSLVISTTVLPPYHIFSKLRTTAKLHNSPALKTIVTTIGTNRKDARSVGLHQAVQGLEAQPKENIPLYQQIQQRREEELKEARLGRTDGSEKQADGWNSSSSSNIDGQGPSAPLPWGSSPSSNQQPTESFQSPSPPPNHMQQQQQQGTEGNSQARPQPPSWGTSSTFNESMSGLDGFDDDKSRTDPSQGNQQGGVTPGQGHAATSWEEIRKRNQAASRQGGSTTQAGNSPPGAAGTGTETTPGQEQYTYSENDKDVAQRQFDAMLEAERKGAENENWKP